MCLVRFFAGRSVAQLNGSAAPGRRVAARLATLALALCCAGAPAGASAPMTSKAPDLTKFSPRTPTRPVHTEYVVETNHFGQVTRVRSVRPSTDPPFNALTYGNALQAFIRTTQGRAVAGTYKLAYDYNPQTKNVRRSVALVRAGGVNADAPGAVLVEAEKLRRESQKAAEARANASPLPDFHHITTRRH